MLTETVNITFDEIIDTYMEEDKDNMGYFSDERFDSDNLNDASKRDGYPFDVNAEENPYSNLDRKPAARPTVARQPPHL